jgi:thiamine-monophosphate kinase
VAVRKARQRLQEFPFIQSLQRRFPSRDPAVIRGIGDDAAVVSAGETWWHLTTDLLAEGVHFDLRTASCDSVGYRAAIANLSDLAAMGATPRFLLTSLAVPQSSGWSDLQALYGGLMNACRQYRVRLIGGDTSASRAGLFMSLTLLGESPRGRALFRTGARPGDAIFVTGTLGDSRAGLQLLQHKSSARRLTDRQRRFLVNRHLHPSARVAEGAWLSHARLATAAIDLSDGLSGDLHHLCEESAVGAEIDARLLPLSPALWAFARALRQDPVRLALAGGEDYELLFTVPPGKLKRVEREAGKRHFRVTCIGTVRPAKSGVRLCGADGTMRPLRSTSYEHFRPSSLT